MSFEKYEVLKGRIGCVAHDLDARDLFILEHRLNGSTSIAIAGFLALSQQRVSQIQKRAWRIIRREMFAGAKVAEFEIERRAALDAEFRKKYPHVKP